MSDYKFRIVIVTQPDLSDTSLHQEMVYFLAGLPEELQGLLQGPTRLHNGYVQYTFCAAVGKIGGRIDELHYQACQDLLRRYARDAVQVTWTEDGLEPRARFGSSPERLPRSLG